ncbi:MAG: SDR family NAD(P)-dependent oxidoreductase [Myxococcota bacterium]
MPSTARKDPGVNDRSSSSGRLSGRVALVTGSSSGIGAACALRFAEEGAVVAGFDVESEGDERWREAEAVAAGSACFGGDVRDADQLEAAVAGIVERFGRLDVLVNAAGVAGGGPVHLMPPEEWDRVVDVNLKGTFLACRAALPVMLEARSGSIVNVASVEGIEGFEGGSAYNASKGGVVLLTRNIAIDYARRGVRANVVCPGFIETPMFDAVWKNPGLEAYRERVRDAHQLGRFGRPEEIANAALFLASDESSFVTGHSLVVDGGYTAGHRHGITRLMGLE